MNINQLDAGKLRSALQGQLPGLAAQSKMGIDPRVRRRVPHPSGEPRSSAVLILVYPDGGRLWFPLTQRTHRVAQHKSQISLPGGQREKADADLWATALREANEEIGTQPDTVTYLGALTEFYIAPSNYRVQPYVGWLPLKPIFASNAEVDELFEMPLDALLDPATKRLIERELDGHLLKVPCYYYEERVIWGATAMILSEFEAVLANILL